jgi:hypothetical protein
VTRDRRRGPRRTFIEARGHSERGSRLLALPDPSGARERVHGRETRRRGWRWRARRSRQGGDGLLVRTPSPDAWLPSGAARHGSPQKDDGEPGV